jgi:hypothetical protein
MNKSDLTPIVLVDARKQIGFQLPEAAAIRALAPGDLVVLCAGAGNVISVRIEQHQGNRFIGEIASNCGGLPRVGSHIAFHTCNIIIIPTPLRTNTK